MATNESHEAGEWANRIKDVARQPGAYTAPSPANARPWSADFFDCFNPFDLCLITWCCPCVTFGKTHHRLRRGADLTDYSPFNVSCLGYYAAGCCGLHFVLNMMQRNELRERGNLEGDAVTDCLKACCCNVCDLVQQEKEAQYMVLNQQPTLSQPGLKQGMEFTAQQPVANPGYEQGVVPQAYQKNDMVPQQQV